jgi:hypothetical protein
MGGELRLLERARRPVRERRRRSSGGRSVLEDDSDSTSVPLNIRAADTAELTAWILMPERREHANVRAIRHTGDHKNVEAVNVVTRYLAADSPVLAFKLLSLSAGYKYEVSWTYK